MAVSAENRTRPIAGVRTEYDSNEPQATLDRTGMNQTSKGSMVYFVFAALAILVGGYYFYNYYASPTAVTPTVTQAAPAPVVAAPKVDMPAPTTPAQTPAAVPPASPPADVPATPLTDQKTP